MTFPPFLPHGSWKASLGAEIVGNPGFETAGTGGADVWDGWTEDAGNGALANETTLVHGGSDAAKITAGAGANTYVVQFPACVAERTYALSFWTRGDGTNQGRYLVNDITGGYVPIISLRNTGNATTTYTQVINTFRTPAACVNIGIYLYCSTVNTGIAYFDDVTIKLLSESGA